MNVRNSIALAVANVERALCDGPLETPEGKKLHPPFHVHIHSVRARLADSDGISGKAAIDGLVKAGILKDDSPEYVESVTYSQEKGKPEKTIVRIYGQDN